MVRVEQRIGRTADGRLVEYDDPECAFLAYVPGDEVPDADAKRAGLTEFLSGKSLVEPANKMRTKPADKGRTKEIT